MKQRSYYYITGTSATGYQTQKVNFESEDLYDREIITLAFHISELHNADKILKLFGLREDTNYFYDQCRSVISVSESHQNDKGEGKFAFQAYFHNFPESVIHVNDRAIVVVSLEPKDEVGANGLRDYWLVGYIHANVFDFRDKDGSLHEGFYYNMLRISERSENGKKVYRRKKIFTMIFSVLHSLVEVYGVHFAYASMGKENQAIHDALVLNSKKYNKHFETFPVRTNTHLNILFDSRSASKKLVDISHNKEKLKEMYKMLHEKKSDYIFSSIHSEEAFFRLLDNIFKYSKTSKVYMLPDEKGNIAAATLAVNWGDYFALTLDNPKGFFKFVASLKLSDNLLYPIHVIGDEKSVQTLLKGVAYIYRKNHGVYISVINSYEADKYKDVKKSMLFDDYIFFIISDRLEHFNALKERSKAAPGESARFFIDNPIL
jgi:hypothetical protein